jgi:hypothetical protein
MVLSPSEKWSTGPGGNTPPETVLGEEPVAVPSIPMG